jgi:hypothetical protein
MTLCFLREFRVLRGGTSFFIKCKEFTIRNLIGFSSIEVIDNGRICGSGKIT